MDGLVSSESLPQLIELAARHDAYFEERLKNQPVTKMGVTPVSSIAPK